MLLINYIDHKAKSRMNVPKSMNYVIICNTFIPGIQINTCDITNNVNISNGVSVRYNFIQIK